MKYNSSTSNHTYYLYYKYIFLLIGNLQFRGFFWYWSKDNCVMNICFRLLIRNIILCEVIDCVGHSQQLRLLCHPAFIRRNSPPNSYFDTLFTTRFSLVDVVLRTVGWIADIIRNVRHYFSSIWHNYCLEYSVIILHLKSHENVPISKVFSRKLTRNCCLDKFRCMPR